MERDIELTRRVIKRKSQKINQNSYEQLGLTANLIIPPKVSTSQYADNASTAEWCFGEVHETTGEMVIYPDHFIEVDGLFGPVRTSYDPVNRVIIKELPALNNLRIEMHYNEHENMKDPSNQLFKNAYYYEENGRPILRFFGQTNGVTVEQGSAIMYKGQQLPRIEDILIAGI